MYHCAPTGIIIVPLPKKAHTPPLSESRSHAVKRFLSEAWANPCLNEPGSSCKSSDDLVNQVPIPSSLAD